MLDNGFDYFNYLKRHLLVGQIDPWRKTDEGKPFYTLLVSVEIAMEECRGWSNQDFTRHDFITYLKTKDTLVLSSPEEVNNLQLKVEDKESKEPKKVRIPKAKTEGKFKRLISDERREQLRNQAAALREKRKASML